ncbi:prepilin peptidase [Mycobacterium kubicae]|uniref:Prepilin peptidase n=1 Tax=Mycobacterium kubicae TaxID=120959 RepID=A0AAX1JHM1_9MYCO|nr:A24 family peptidase [Mycobacterium kubicae]MCV7097237.1 prepilin peptidase [Mycobacterium kubicae]OBK41340.1 type IV prepilin leader peptidase [Mycobacterium kubicae]ORW03927.1 type IV prepilin leader peptidase [Mycobacterium kubicae]QNI11629.1 prepilin peptidase [Mycobacterium kubicae]QPI39848.1 prepilin peptidase [Mycobacterium kubicae]
MRIAAAAVVLAWLTMLSCYDLRQRRLPNWLTLPGAAVILAGAACVGDGLPALAGAAGLTGLYLAVHLITPAAMGAGDVKLAIGLGGLCGCFGAAQWFLAALAAPLLTALFGLLALTRGARSVPHGPSMCVASAWAAGSALLG